MVGAPPVAIRTCLALSNRSPTCTRSADSNAPRPRITSTLVLRQVSLVVAAHAFDVSLATLTQTREIVRTKLDVETVAGGTVQCVGDLGGVPHHLFGDAAHVHARAAELCGFDQGDASTVLRGPTR